MSQVIDKLAWIRIADRRVLTARSRGKETYYIPGGKREHGETDAQALVREIKEELDLALIPETIRYVGTYEAQAHGKAEGVVVKMTCYSADHRGEIVPSAEIKEVAWFRQQDKDKCSPVARIILDRLKANGLID